MAYDPRRTLERAANTVGGFVGWGGGGEGSDLPHPQDAPKEHEDGGGPALGAYDPNAPPEIPAGSIRTGWSMVPPAGNDGQQSVHGRDEAVGFTADARIVNRGGMQASTLLATPESVAGPAAVSSPGMPPQPSQMAPSAPMMTTPTVQPQSGVHQSPAQQPMGPARLLRAMEQTCEGGE